MSQPKDNEPKILDHDYDGIKEFDNPLPAWWLFTFGATVIFAFLYWIDAETGGRKTQMEAVEAELVELRKLKPTEAAASGNEDDFKQFALVATNLNKGKEVFAAKCAVCHGPEGQGTIGPNLTDDYWINGKGLYTDVHKVVREGVLDKGMPNWDTLLSAEDVKSVTVFVVSLKGTSPANPKPPQGEKVAP